MKTVFTLLGYYLNETSSSKLATLNNGLTAKGYNVVPVDISWKYKTHTQYVKEFVELYNKHKTEENIVIGNSFGAVVAFIAAPIVKPDKIYLCSLSPFFKEDRVSYPDSYAIKFFGKRRTKDFRSYSADSLAREIAQQKIPTTVVYGEKERQTSPVLAARCQQTSQAIPDSELIEIPNCPHNMVEAVYSQAMLGML